jgi:hypothetical protein
MATKSKKARHLEVDNSGRRAVAATAPVADTGRAETGAGADSGRALPRRCHRSRASAVSAAAHCR